MKKTIKQKIGGFIIPRLPFSRETFNVFRYELKTLRIRINNRINPVKLIKINKIKKGEDLSVNIGPGPFGEEGWINIDTSKMKNVTIVADARKKLPFKSNSVLRIRCEHVFEHYDINDVAPFFLKETYRVLKEGSVLRIVVPDMKKFIEAYYLNTEEKWAEIDVNISAWESPIYVLNHVFRQSGEHKFGYDYDSLEKLVSKYGFIVKKQTFGESVDEKLKKDMANHAKHSIYIDCIKR